MGMNALKRELKSCMSQLIAGETNELSATFVIPSGFSGFKGHFPGKPVLPGVCMVQAALVMLAVWTQAPVTLSNLVSAKWFAPVMPEDELRFVCSGIRKTLPGTTVKVRITRGGDKIADLSLKVAQTESARNEST